MDVQKPVAVDSGEPDLARWRSAVAGVLAKSTRRDPADLPAEPERLLDSPTYEGFPIRPLYTSLDALPEPSLPGQWPYVRGGDALRDVKSGWRVAEAFPANGAAAADANGAVLLALTEGVSALVLRVGGAAAELDRLLEGVFLDLVPVALDAGVDYAAATDALQLTDYGTRDKWLAARMNGVGASESAALFGVSPWHTPLSLWAEKTGKPDEKPSKV